MSTAQQMPRAVPAIAPRPAGQRLALLMGGMGLLLTLFGLGELFGDLPRQTVLRDLTTRGGWQRAMVAEGVHDVALRAEAAALRSGRPAALADGATILASLSTATGDPQVIADLHRRSLALAEVSLHKAPTRARTHLVTGAILAAEDPASARASHHLAHAASLDPNSASLRRRIGLVDLERGRGEQAATHFRVALAGNPALAQPLYELLADLAVELSPDEITPPTPRAEAALGAWLNQNGEFDAAERAFRRGLQVAETGTDHDETLWAYRRLYSYFTSRQRFKEAEDLTVARLATGLHNQPRARALLLYYRGVALMRLKRPQEAVPLLSEATTLRPDTIHYLNFYASALSAADHPGEAASVWQQALALPRQTESERNREIPMRLARAHSLQAAGEPRIALAELRRVLMAEPDHIQARQLAAELAYE